MMMVAFGPPMKPPPDEGVSLDALLSQPMPDKVKKKVAMLGAILAQAMMKKDDDK